MTHAVLAFGRMNPPTTGHEKFIKKTHDVAKKVGGTAHVVASHSEGTSKNPIPQKKKLGYIKKIAHPDVHVSGSSKQHPSILHHAAKLHAAGHTHLHVVAAGDRESHFHKLLHQYNGKKGPHGHYNFKSITVHSSGKRDPDSHDHSEGVSGTSMRQHARDNNHKEFKKGLPKALHPHKDEIMNHINTQKEDLDQDFETLEETVWKTPHHTDEHDEVHTQAGTPHGTFPGHVHKMLDHLKDKDNYHTAMKAGTTTRVSPLHARKLGNTDAGNPKGTRGLEGEKVKRVGSLGKTQTKPIALKDKHTGHMHLLAGNTRLTHSASQGDTTHVHTIHYDSSKMNEEQELPIAGRPGVDSFRRRQEAERRRKMRQQGLKTVIKKRPTEESVEEGGMPSSVIKHKETLASMSHKDLATKIGHHDEKTLRQMAWRHGYGKMSSHYVDRIKKSTNEDLDQEFENLIEALNVVQRIKRKLIMRRIRPKLNRAKRLFKHRKVPEKNLKQRARKAGIKFVRKRVAGKKGTQYTKLSAAAKMHIDKKVSKQQKIVTNIARRLLPRARKAELVRLQRNELEQDFADYLKERTNSATRQDGKPFERENSPTAAAKTKHKYKDKNEKGARASSVTEQDLQSLYLKATKGEYPFETILEVFVRGIEDWDGGSNSPAQYAFNRVNSFVAGGKAYEMDYDLVEASSKHAADQTSQRDRKIGRKSDALRSKQSISTKSTTLFKRRHGGKTSQHRQDTAMGRSSSAEGGTRARRPKGGIRKMHRDLTKYNEKDFRRVHGKSKSAARQSLAKENFSMATGSAGYAQSETSPPSRVKGKKKKVLEWGTDEATAHAKNMTPGEVNELAPVLAAVALRYVGSKAAKAAKNKAMSKLGKEVNEALPLSHPQGYMEPKLLKVKLGAKPKGKTFFQGFNDRKNKGIKSKPIDKDKFFGKKKVEEKLGFDTHTDVVAKTDAASEKPKRKPKREDPLPTFAQLSRIGPDWRQNESVTISDTGVRTKTLPDGSTITTDAGGSVHRNAAGNITKKSTPRVGGLQKTTTTGGNTTQNYKGKLGGSDVNLSTAGGQAKSLSVSSGDASISSTSGGQTKVKVGGATFRKPPGGGSLSVTKEELDYKMTYHKHHTSGDGADKKLHKTVTHTSVKFDEKPTTPERVQHVVQNSDVHKNMKKKGYDIHTYGSHKKDHGAFERNHGTKVAYEEVKEGKIAGSIRWVGKWKDAGHSKEEAHRRAKELDIHPKVVNDLYKKKDKDRPGMGSHLLNRSHPQNEAQIPGRNTPKWNAPDSGREGMSRKKLVKSMIQQEKDRDKRKHDQMMDRARLRDTHKKNSEE